MAAPRTVTSPPSPALSRLPPWIVRASAPAICAAISLLVGAHELGLFSTSLSLPLRYSYVDDTKFYLALIKGVLDHGWWTTNPSLGFPFGQQLYDFPQGGDTLNLVLIHGIGLFSGNPAWVANVFLLLTFPLNALAAFFVLRRFEVSAPASVAAAVIFSVLPYSFAHVSQLLLAAYYSVPLAAYLFLRVVSGEPLFERRGGSWVTRRSVVTVALCAIVGLADLYYAAFAILLILGGAIVVAITRGSIRALVPGVLVAAAIGVVLAVALAPSFVYRAGHGTNPALARTTVDTRTLGLQFTGLVLPVRGHRVSFLSHLNQRYFDPRGTPSYCEACSETVGTVGDVGLVWLLALVLTGIVGVGRLSPRFALDRRAALGVALSLLIGTVSGVSGLIGLFVTNDIRAWNRMSLCIAFFAL